MSSKHHFPSVIKFSNFTPFIICLTEIQMKAEIYQLQKDRLQNINLITTHDDDENDILENIMYNKINV